MTREADNPILREDIINAVLAKHRVTRADLIGASRLKKISEARKDAARRLKEAGFGLKRIGQVLNRRSHSVCYMLKPPKDRGEEKRFYKILHDLPADVRDVLGAIAEAEDVSPQTIMREWIYERARFEADAKARAA